MVTVCYCDANDFRDIWEQGLLLLPKERKEKAERLFRVEDKILSVMAGLMLRKIFLFSEEKPLSFFEHGKPYFEGEKPFSVSHSGTLAVLAVSENEVGADVQKITLFKESVTRRCFTKEEQDHIGSDAQKFAELWTRKEAVLKWTGEGISVPLNSFCVLPLNEKTEISGEKIWIDTFYIGDYPVSIAYAGEKQEIFLKKFSPKELLG